MRCLHALLAGYPHRAWLYVDDLKGNSCMQATAKNKHCMWWPLSVLSRYPYPGRSRNSHSKSPGWCFDFAQETVHYSSREAREAPLQHAQNVHSKVLRKKLEALLGLLMWATSTCTHLRPYMAPLYRDLHSGVLRQLHASQWHPFTDALDEQAVVRKSPVGLWLPLHTRIMEVNSSIVTCKQDILGPSLASAAMGQSQPPRANRGAPSPRKQASTAVARGQLRT